MNADFIQSFENLMNNNISLLMQQYEGSVWVYQKTNGKIYIADIVIETKNGTSRICAVDKDTGKRFWLPAIIKNWEQVEKSTIDKDFENQINQIKNQYKPENYYKIQGKSEDYYKRLASGQLTPEEKEELLGKDNIEKLRKLGVNS